MDIGGLKTFWDNGFLHNNSLSCMLNIRGITLQYCIAKGQKSRWFELRLDSTQITVIWLSVICFFYMKFAYFIICALEFQLIFKRENRRVDKSTEWENNCELQKGISRQGSKYILERSSQLPSLRWKESQTTVCCYNLSLTRRRPVTFTWAWMSWRTFGPWPRHKLELWP